MFRQWKPDAYYPTLAEVPVERLYQDGFRLALLDIDNTLHAHGSHEADAYASEQVARFRAGGFQVYVLSNARQDRALSFGRELGVTVIGSAGKPGTQGVERALAASGVGKAETLLIGDQLFTDIWSGTRAGVRTILVDRLNPDEPWYIRLKRLGERIVKNHLKIKGHYDQLA